MTEREFLNKNAVEVDGIRFEIIMPEIVFVLPIPKAKPGNNTSVQLGVRITNNTSNPDLALCRLLCSGSKKLNSI
ncbi:hypothetical protein [Microcoleus sp. herbarium14]|uniref:hypothetical protein n=1 Tax=Microcoleus sp. herbarium14 TaxID=3055439 RepID=UPI002FD70125